LIHLIIADIEAGRPVAVLDPKQQLIDTILGAIPKNRTNDVVELNASDETPVGFNPVGLEYRILGLTCGFTVPDLIML
jgi:hypothetical protein